MNPFQELEYKEIMQDLSKIWLANERHGGDYIRWDMASIRIDIKTKLYKNELKSLLKKLILYKINSRLHKGKKSRYSWMNNYLLHYEIILPQLWKNTIQEI
jgi:hypothetical protein